MTQKFTNPTNLYSIFEALRIENGEKSYFLSGEKRENGKRLLAEWRDSSPLDDRRLGAATVLAAIEANPDDIDGVRLAALEAPQEVQSLLFLHGTLEGFTRDLGAADSDLVGRLF